MNENIDNPDYKNITPFKGWVIENFPFIEADFDAITNYQLISKVVEYLNQVISNENLTEQQIETLTTAYNNLENYVNNYFDNLDIQEEINIKLDEMAEDGTLTNLIKDYVDPIYEEYESQINQNIEAQNSRIDEIDEKVDSAVTGSPLVATSTSEMTDTTRVYVNTTDGKWYYYDGDSWEIGGTYQSTGIANNSIDIFKLTSDLQENFITRYGTYESLGTDHAGYTTNNDGVVGISSSSSYVYNVVSLDVNKIYIWNGYNSQYIRGLIIADSSDNIIYDSETVVSGSELDHYIFVPKILGIKAYITYGNKISTNNAPYVKYVGGTLRKINNTSNSLKNDTTITKVNEISTSYFSIDTNESSAWYNTPLYQSYAQSSTDVYAIEKGKKYTFHGYDWSSIKGIIITDNNYDVKDYTPAGSTLTEVTKTFVAEYDGFAFCHNVKNNGYTFTCTLPTIDDIKNKVINSLHLNANNVGFSKYIAIGDSITEENFRCLHNYLYWINQDIPDLTITNLGKGGTGYKRESEGNDTFINRLSQIDSYDLSDTIITVFGSVNDLTYVENDLGELGDITTATLYGAMYVFFNTLFTNFNGVRVGCITPFTKKSNDPRLAPYCKALKETCELFHVPFLDMRFISNLRPENTAFLNAYYSADGDGSSGQVDENGVHPNSAGHRLFYGRVKDFINKL